MSKIKIVALIFLSLLFITASQINAAEGGSGGGKGDGSGGGRNKKNAQASSSAKVASPKSCQDIEKSFKNQARSLQNRATVTDAKFAQVSKAVEDYYSGLSKNDQKVSNYKTLTSDIASTAASLKKSEDKFNQEAQNFNCDGNPKDKIKAMRGDFKSVIDDLKSYRSAIKSLILAIDPSAEGQK